MKIIEITSTEFPDAHELPNKTGIPPMGRQKSSPAGRSGGNKKNRVSAPNPVRQKLDQAVTAENRMMLVILANGKRHWTREKVWRDHVSRS